MNVFRERWYSLSRGEFEAGSEELRTRQFAYAFLALLLPFFLAFACLHFSLKENLRGAVLVCTLVGLSWLLSVLRTTRNETWVYRGSLALLGAFSVYLVILSGTLGNTNRLLFLLLIPLFGLFTLGRREGLLWVLCVSVLWVPFFVVPINAIGTQPPPTDFLLLFMATFFVVSGTAYISECIRDEYQRTMGEERRRLAKEIEERERFERILDQSEKRYRTLFESAGDAILVMEVVDEDLRIRECNRATLDMLGCTPEQIKGRSTLEFGALEIVESDLFLKERARRLDEVISGDTWRFESCHRRLNGEQFETEVVMTPFDVHEGPHVLGIVRDISQRKRMEEKLKESEKRFRDLAGLLPEIVFEVDQDGTVVFVNQNASVVTGHSEAELASGFDAFQLIAPEDRERAKETLLERMEKGQSGRTEYTAIRKNGERFPALVRSAPILSGDEVLGLRGILVDVSDQKKAEGALIEEKEFSDSIVNSLPGNFFVLDPEGKALLWNRNVEATTGYSTEEVQRMTPDRFFVPEDRDRVRQAISSAFLEGELDVETSLLTRAGVAIPYHYRGVKATIGGRPLLVGLGIDITPRIVERKEKSRLESRLRKAQNMEAVGTLAGGIAHDFNNVLAVITGFTELAISDASEDTIQKENLEEVLSASKRAKNLVQQILTFSRQEERERGPLEIQRIVKGTLKHVRTSLPDTIRMHQRLEAESAIVTGNAVEIHQMLMHLCANAEQAMRDEGGVLEVTLSEEILDPQTAAGIGDLRPGAYLKLVVRDTGRGMDKTVLDRIFDPFFSTKAPGEGTGMGLSVVHGIVKGVGGSMSVASQVGHGSTFTVWLPETDGTVDNEDTEKESKAVNSNGDKTNTILVVDDEEQIRRMLRQMLEKEGFRVMEASDGKEALRMQASDPADLVITDIFMPETDGFETIRELRKDSTEVGILAISGGGKTVKEDLLPYAEMLGADRILEKPLVREELMEAIRGIQASR